MWFEDEDEDLIDDENEADLTASIVLDHTAPKVAPFMKELADAGFIPGTKGISKVTIIVEYTD